MSEAKTARTYNQNHKAAEVREGPAARQRLHRLELSRRRPIETRRSSTTASRR